MRTLRARLRAKTRVPVAAVVLSAILGAGLAGCSGGTTPSIPSVFQTPASNFSNFFASVNTAATGTTSEGKTPDFECPGVTVRDGAATFAQSAVPGDDSAMNLRHQAGIGQTARECKQNGPSLTMRVGVQGRVILGPAGGPGSFELPLRLAVVHEGPEPKTIHTKLVRIPVTIQPGDLNVPFTYIEEDLTFPMPRPAGLIDEYVVYVGFDPVGFRETPKRPQRPRTSSARPQR
jgi:hypothetical protein